MRFESRGGWPVADRARHRPGRRRGRRGRGRRREGRRRGRRRGRRGRKGRGPGRMIEPAAKERALRDTLAALDSVIVAYSGGVDSAYLAYVASRTLGDRAIAVTADSPSYPDRHRRLAVQIARDFGLRHEIIQTTVLERREY